MGILKFFFITKNTKTEKKPNIENFGSDYGEDIDCYTNHLARYGKHEEENFVPAELTPSNGAKKSKGWFKLK